MQVITTSWRVACTKAYYAGGSISVAIYYR